MVSLKIKKTQGMEHMDLKINLGFKFELNRI